MVIEQRFIYAIAAVICAFLFSYLTTPAVRALAFRIGAVSVPKDNRHIHKEPMPALGGLAVYFSFSLTTLIFCEPRGELYAMWLGGTVLVILGVLDDVFDLGPWIKLLVQVVSAVCAMLAGVLIRGTFLFSQYVEFGWLSYPLTVLWIVVLVNAFNLIDGLDGLASGICAISCVSLALVALLYGSTGTALFAAVLFGACAGFLPFNFYPAKIFIGNTGAYFLGYILAVISVSGVFKISAVISFLLPVIIFALPLFDTVFAFFRRIAHGQAPFAADKKHVHHRLLELGLTQRRAVLAMYAVSGLFGLIAVLFTDRIIIGERIAKSVVLVLAAAVVCTVDFLVLVRAKKSRDSGKAGHDDQGDTDTSNKTPEK